jgi:hypothetical protein
MPAEDVRESDETGMRPSAIGRGTGIANYLFIPLYDQVMQAVFEVSSS